VWLLGSLDQVGLDLADTLNEPRRHPQGLGEHPAR
jgi:hypothetical protein